MGIGALWFFYDRNEKRKFEAKRRMHVFHCVRCGNLYSTKEANTEEGDACPNCSYKNYELSY